MVAKFASALYTSCLHVSSQCRYMRIQNVLLSVPTAGKTHCAPLYKGTEWAVKCARGFTKAQTCRLCTLLSRGWRMLEAPTNPGSHP